MIIHSVVTSSYGYRHIHILPYTIKNYPNSPQKTFLAQNIGMLSYVRVIILHSSTLYTFMFRVLYSSSISFVHFLKSAVRALELFPAMGRLTCIQHTTIKTRIIPAEANSEGQYSDP